MMDYLRAIFLLALVASVQAQEGFQVRFRFSLGTDDDSQAPSPMMMDQDNGPSLFRRFSFPLLMRNMFSNMEESQAQQQESEEPATMRIIRIVSSDDQQAEQQEEENPFATVSRMFMRLRGLVQAVQENSMAMSQEQEESEAPRHTCPLRRACQGDIERLCADAEGVPGAVPTCLRSNMERLSEQCSTMLQKFLQPEPQDNDELQGGESDGESTQEPEYTSQDSDDTKETVSSSSAESSSSEQPEPVQKPQGPCSDDAARLCPGITDKREILQCLLRAEVSSHDLSNKCHSLLLPLVGHEGRSVRPSAAVPKIHIQEVKAGQAQAAAPAPTSFASTPLLIGAAAFTVLGVIVVVAHRRRARAGNTASVSVQLANPVAQIVEERA